MRAEPRYPEFLGVKLPADLADEIRRQAREDDRTISGFLRRVIVAGLQKAPSTERGDEPR